MNHIQGKCSTCYNVHINGVNLYNIKSCTHLEDSRTKMYNYIYKNKRVFLPVFAKNVQYYRKNVEYIKKRITFQHIYIHNNFLLNKYLSIH